jgi:hypothetical protein
MTFFRSPRCIKTAAPRGECGSQSLSGDESNQEVAAQGDSGHTRCSHIETRIFIKAEVVHDLFKVACADENGRGPQ